jgi:Superinfection immunity protein
MFEFAVIGFLLYLLPTIIAVLRDHQSRMAIFALNLFFGWTMIGWFIAFIWSLTGVYDRYRGVPPRWPPPSRF